MECGIRKQHYCTYQLSFFNHSSCLPSSVVSFPNGKNISTRWRTIIMKSSSSENKNPSSTTQQKTELGIVEDHPDPDPESNPNLLSSSLLHRLREGFKLDGLGMDILSIALPAALALAAEPITSLVDTGFVGHLGSAELAAVGVSGAVFNLVSKLFNVPLLNVTTSFVAEEQALVTKASAVSSQTTQDQQIMANLPSISTSLVLAAVLGIAEAVALSKGSSILMNTMGFSNAHAS